MLTNTGIDAMGPGERLKDDRVPGLEVRCHKSGKSFLLYYRTRTGIARRPKLGNYPEPLSIAKARDIARDMLAKVAAGQDPVAERNTARGEPTMDDLAERCGREHYNTTEWDREAMRLYRRNAGPILGNVRLRSVGYSAVHGVHVRLRSHPVEANRTIAVLSRMLNLAERWSWRDTGSNPCQHVERYPELKRRRYASAAEIAKLGEILDRHAEKALTDNRRHRAENLSGIAFLYLLMFSGARPSEIANGTPDMVARAPDGAGVLRFDYGKTGQRDVFLPPQAMRVLDKLPPNRKRLANRKTTPKWLWALVREEAGCPDLWARDWRRTFATIGLTAGVTPGQLGELLGHKSVQTTKIYAKLLEDAAHTAAAGIAGRMEQLLGGSKVGAENR